MSPAKIDTLSIKLPIKKTLFPKYLGITNVVAAGKNTINIPDITPVSDNGKVTFKNALKLEAPRSVAASIKPWSIFCKTV